ncbi:type VI secretion system tip protein VgrG [Pseudomonas sp. CCC3.1]|uniref:type VI secretion system Vgr family protein n=1 Tax=Pseudomonas sp. CCC3.1 TaxID=3048607 RepID=UPI002AC93B2A|nr:type VI secretion system tip protein VgrG [Pseudomonas sp. CCC3.1]MEB0207478.1 type VI secretion system tip protein VgrG [Pseudomonas sp. CCC3.1]WPX37829.1 type VI secretion system tip protein VgrG [Pseudomonas sp. CCC3.1]
MSRSQPPFRFSLTLDGFTGDLQVLSFTGKEAISTPYAFELVLISERSDLDLVALLHTPAFLAYAAEGVGIHGHIHSIAQGDTRQRLTFYTLTLVPQLAYLEHRTHQRVFQQLTVEQVIGQLLEEHGIFSNACTFKLDTTYQARDYCVQYHETDLHFVQRLCEEEGIHYHFRHSAQGHHLVFGDGQSAFATLEHPAPFHSGSGLVAEEPSISRFAVGLNTRSTRSTLRDYHFETASREVVADYGPDGRSTERDLEDYRYPGHFKLEQRGQLLSQRALERQRADRCQASGESDQCTLSSGHFMTLSEHPQDAWNAMWLLTAIHHEGRQPQVLEESGTAPVETPADGFVQGYRNDFIATPWDVFYRPALKHPKPQVLGMQTARVSGPANEEVHCDSYGRVKVQFHWDREGQHNDSSSCWLRVASSWAGDRYGAVTLPRVGMEVLVAFLEGDPDKPVISGCLANSINPTPYPLPAHKTRSVLRSRSTPSGTGYNELHLEDRKGQELIYLHAQRDLEQHIKNDSHLQIDGLREETITGNSVSVLKGEDQRTVSGDRKVQINANDFRQVAVSSHTAVGVAMAVEAGMEVTVKAGAHVVLSAGACISLMAGGQHLLVSAAGIYVSSPILLGGVPIPGMQALPAVTSDVAPLTAAVLTPTQINSLKRNAPFCEECEKCKGGVCDI